MCFKYSGDMDTIFVKILLVLSVWRDVYGTPVAMLQHATSSQSIMFNPVQAPSTTIAPTPTVAQLSNIQPKYEFKYEVADHQSGDRKSHWERRDGDSVRGVYTLYEPDGALRTVEYTADALHGFNAMVKRSMASKHERADFSSKHDTSFISRFTPDLGYPVENKALSNTGHSISKGYLKPKAAYIPGVNFSVDHGVAKPGDTPFIL